MFLDISPIIGKSYEGKVINGSVDFSSLLTDSGVAVIPGLPFHADNFVRLSYAVSIKDIEEGFNRIEKFLSKLKWKFHRFALSGDFFGKNFNKFRGLLLKISHISFIIRLQINRRI